MQRMAKKEADVAMKEDECETVATKIEEVLDRIEDLETVAMQHNVKYRMKLQDVELYSDMLKPYFGGRELRIEDVESEKKELKALETKIRETNLQISLLK